MDTGGAAAAEVTPGVVELGEWLTCFWMWGGRASWGGGDGEEGEGWEWALSWQTRVTADPEEVSQSTTFRAGQAGTTGWVQR